MTLAFAAPSNDNITSAQIVTGSAGAASGSNVGSTREVGEPNHAGRSTNTTVWFKWTAPLTKSVSFDTIGSNFDTVLAVYMADVTPVSAGALTPVTSDDDNGGNFNSRVIFSAISSKTYYLVVAGYGNASGSIFLNWASASANDNFAAAESISGLSGSLSRTNLGASRETDEPSHANAGGGASVWFKWTAPEASNFSFDTIGSNFSTLLGIYKTTSSPAKVSALEPIASDFGSGGKNTSLANFNAVVGTTYYIAVDGYDGAQGMINFHWAVTPPDNDNFDSALDLYDNSGQTSVINKGATPEWDEPDHDGNAPVHSVWYRWRPSVSQRVTIDTIGSNIDTVLAVYAIADETEPAAFDNIDAVASDDDSGGSSSSKVSFNAYSNGLYYIAVDGYGGARGTVNLNWAVNPANDDFISPQFLEGETGRASATNVGASQELGEPSHAGIAGGKSVWFQWIAPGNGRLTLSTGPTDSPSDFDTLLAVYTGDDVANLAPVSGGVNDNISSTNLTSRAAFNVTEGTIYSIAVDGKNTATGIASGNITLDWAFVYSAPPNNNFSAAQTLTGTSGTVPGTILAATKETGEPQHNGDPGGTSVWYQWTAPANRRVTFQVYDNVFDKLLGIYKASSTTPTVNALTTVASANYNNVASFNAVSGTTYYIAVDATYVDASYNAGKFNLYWAVAPTNDNFSAAVLISGKSGSVTGNNVGATTEAGEPYHAGTDQNASVWFKWKAPNSGSFSFDSIDSEFETLLGIYQANGSPASVNDLFSIGDYRGGNGTSRASFIATSGVTYYIAVDGVSGATGNIILRWYGAPTNDNFASAQPLSGNAGSWSGNNHAATQEDYEPDHAGEPGGKSVWFKWTPASSGYGATFNTLGSDFDTVMAVYTGSSLDALTPVATNNDSDTDQTSQVKFNPISGQTYFIAVDGVGANEGSLQLRWSFNTTSPPPNDLFANAEILNGDSGTVSGGNLRATPNQTGEPTHANVSGGASVWYQWRAPASGQVIFNTSGSAIDTLLGIYTGTSVGALTKVTDNDDVDGTDRFSIASFNPTAGVNYYIAVDGKNNGSGAEQGTITLNWAFTPSPATITSFSPSSGPVGTKVTIKGVNLRGVTSAQFNGTDAVFTSFSDSIVATVPYGATTGKIFLSTQYGDSTSVVNFTVTTPTISSISPISGGVGTIVIVSGANFTGASAVNFNGVSAGAAVSDITAASSGFQVVSSTQIKAKVPASATTGPVTVVNSGGTATGGVFTVLPVISSLSPTSGPANAVVTINGTSFYDVTNVTFNGKAAVFLVNSPNRITANVPVTATTGSVKVYAGVNASNSVTFTVTSPVLTSFSPSSGPVGAVVTLTGANFTGTTAVRFNGVSAGAAVADITSATAGFQIVSATQIKVKVPAATTGPISVTNPGGTATSTANFTFLPLISNFTPSSGAVGTVVTINGSNFEGVSRVDFNGLAANFILNSSARVTATVPVGATTGPIKLTISGSAGTGSSTSSTSFTVTSPRITSFTPTSGLTGTIVTLTGVNFTGTTVVRFNGVSAGAAVADITSATAGFQIVSATQIKVKVPAGITTGPISVTNPGGTAFSATNFGASPIVSSFTPTRGLPGTTVNISGAFFNNVTSVKFNEAEASFVVKSSNLLTVIVPASALTGKISVTTSTGSGINSGDFTVGPIITDFSPTEGQPGDIVIIDGSNFTGATTVAFDGVSAGSQVTDIAISQTGFVIVSDNQIKVRVPVGATTGIISVTNAGGSPTLNGFSTTEFSVTPRIISFTPTSGAAGIEITMTGSNFTGTNSVIFKGGSNSGDDKPADFTVVSDTQIKVTIPVNAYSGPLQVTNNVGSTVSTSLFTAAPRISVFSPTSGPIGTIVTISGANLMGTTAVKFNSVSATDFAVNAAGTQITVTVPTGAVSGKISVTTVGGTGSSAVDFTVTSTGPDTMSPVPVISTPTANQSLAIASFNNITGSATDNVGVAQVLLKLFRTRNGVTQYWNGSAFTTTAALFPATVTSPGSTSTAWSFTVSTALRSALDGGAYIVFAYAKDVTGNQSPAVSRTFTLTTSSPSSANRASQTEASEKQAAASIPSADSS